MSNFIKPFSIATLAQWKGKISIHKKLVRSKKVVIHQKSELRQDLRARLFFLCCSQSQVLVTPVGEKDRRKMVSVGSCVCNEQVKRGTASALLNKFLKNFKINKTKAKDCSRRNASYSVCISNWYKSDKKLKNGPKIVLFLFRMKQVVVVHLHEILQISNWQSSVIFLCVSDHQLSRNCLKLTRSLFCCSSSKVLVMLDSKHKSLFV